MRTTLLVSVFVVHAATAAVPDFSREVRPILSQHCFKCHGPDKQKGKLRLDQRESAVKAAESDEIAIVPGKPEASELLRRVTSHDDDEVMPPREGGNKPLTEKQIETLRTWIAAGAEYKTHWAYVAPVKAAVPENANAIDHFIRERLKAERLQPASPASLETLCRRLHLDLIGLPPSPEAVEAFVQSANRNRQSAIEQLVDSLLASPRFGEKWARHWLDLARYGDSAGYQHDDDMPLWLFRDWVIRAFNADMPFDQFTIEQIAGDLLPNATLDQRIATGFHRGATVTLGADQNVDELRAQLVWDRVNTHQGHYDAMPRLCQQMDRPCAALIKDLKQRGLLEDTLVVWAGEFGRTPMVQEVSPDGMTGAGGRDHHKDAFSVWVAGGGFKCGLTYGETDEIGCRVVRDAVHVHDLQATLLHQLGLDHERLTYRYQGRDFRLTDVHGKVLKALVA